MLKNINPEIKRILSERIVPKKKLSEKSKIGYDDKRKTQALATSTLLTTTLLRSDTSSDFRNGRYEVAGYKGIGYVSVAEELGL